MKLCCDIAFKEWAVVVDALGRGEQLLILRKGGIHEARGQFQVEHRQFWLFPTQFHAAEHSVVPAKCAAVRELAARVAPDFVDIDLFAVVDSVEWIDSPETLTRLQGCHIWRDQVLLDRFAFGREPGLHALVLRVFRLPAPQRLAQQARYGGCKSWVQLEHPIAADGLTPVLSEAAFAQQRHQLRERLTAHACSHP
jgi:hypothetical protein